MKGTLHKTGSGWQVWYHVKDELYHGSIRVRILPILDHGYVNGPGLSDSDDGKEVEFEVIEFPVPPTNGPVSNNISKYAKLVDKATRPLTEDDAWLTMKEGDITVNFKPMPEFDDPKYPDYFTRAQQLHIQIAEECFKKYPNNKVLYTTDELKDAYKAGVIDGLKEWTLDSYDRPKYPEVKIICPRCKALMPCTCNANWDTIIREFHVASQQVNIGNPPLIFECWLVENYNPPTKKQD